MSNHPHQQLMTPAASPFGAPADPDAAAIRAKLEKELLSLAQDLYEVEVCAGDVVSGKEDQVPEHLEKINRALAKLTELAPQVTDSVPRSIIEHIDKYKNPHQYTKTALSRATGENQYALGRVLGLESFRRQLQDGLLDAFPDLPLPERRHHPLGEDEGESMSAKDTNGSRATVEAAPESAAGVEGVGAAIGSGEVAGKAPGHRDNVEGEGEGGGPSAAPDEALETKAAAVAERSSGEATADAAVRMEAKDEAEIDAMEEMVGADAVEDTLADGIYTDRDRS